MRTLIVVPTYNEIENIDVILRRIRDVSHDVAILVVDDTSPDGTADRAEELGHELGGISVLRRTDRDGLGQAYIAGFAWAIEHEFEVVVGMDADLSHDPAEFPTLLAEIERGSDLVVGSRYAHGGEVRAWSAYRLGLSKAGNAYATWLLRLPVHDATSGYRAYRTWMLAQMGMEGVRARGYAFFVEFVYRVDRGGWKISEVPIVFSDRERGKSKMPARNIIDSMFRVSVWGVRDRLLVLRRRS